MQMLADVGACCSVPTVTGIDFPSFLEHSILQDCLGNTKPMQRKGFSEVARSTRKFERFSCQPCSAAALRKGEIIFTAIAFDMPNINLQLPFYPGKDFSFLAFVKVSGYRRKTN
jgi:hypothetical protein